MTKVPVAIHLRPNLHLIYISKKKSFHHPPSHQRENENPGENPSVGFVRGMTRRTRRLNPRSWSLVKNAVAVVRVVTHAKIEIMTKLTTRSSELFATWCHRRHHSFISLEVHRM
jgi:hypothetical protein